jgi:diguanylate cyclase (GGDEF)-like protein
MESQLDGTLLLEALPDQAAVLDSNGVIQTINQSWRDFAAENGGTVERTGIGVSYLDACLSDGSADMMHVHELLSALLRGEIRKFSYEYPCHSPRVERWFMMRAGHIPGVGALVLHTDISERKLAEMQNEVLATRDPLTSVFNRRGLEGRMRVDLARMRRHGSSLCALLIDCDNFKNINARFGHAAGDHVLAELAERFQDGLRPEDTIARIGGDEFLVLLPETRLSEAAVIAERLLASCARVYASESESDHSHVTCSAAAALLDARVNSLDDILQRCEGGLNEAKVSGKNRVSAEFPAAAIESIESLERELRVAGQAIISLENQALVGVEYLARGVGERKTPDAIFRFARTQDALQRVDTACILRAFDQAAKLTADRTAFINIYPSTMLGLDFEWLASERDKRAISARVCLELCEQEMIGDPNNLRAIAESLRAHSFWLALDDIGFGRTCLESLVLLEPEVVKIDRRFIDGISSDPVRRKQLLRIVSVSKALHARIVAEGIERAADAAIVAQMGIDYGQGYLWGKPELLSF